jgi:F-type H+-transporting ATPase subunit delta
MTMGALAKRYARAILELANEQKQIDRVGKELTELGSMWTESSELRTVFANPAMTLTQRRALLTDIAERVGLSPITKNSLLYINDCGRLAAFPDIARAYAALAEQRGGAVRAEVTSATPLPEAYYAQLQRALEHTTGKKVTIDRKTDANLIAGVITRIGDKVYDGSVRTRLADLKESLRPA